MRGDKQWFDDTIAQCELETQFQNQMFREGMDVRRDAGFSAWFHFNQSGPLAQQHRYDCLPVWMHQTFKDYGGYQAYLDSAEGE